MFADRMTLFRAFVALLTILNKECCSLSSLPTSPISGNMKMNERNPASPSIKRVAIIGAGIGGLTLAHSLGNPKEFAENLPKMDIEMFESRSSWDFEKAGAGIQISGGMAVLKKINPVLQKAIASAALPLKTIESKTKPWVGDDTENGFKLFDFNIESAIRKSGGDTEKELIVDGEVMAYAIMRPALQEILFDQLPKGIKDKTKLGKTLSGVRGDKDSGIFCEFDDGSSAGPFDLVVGCDGVNSAVKEFVNTGKEFSSDLLNKKRGSSNQKIYSGIRIQYCIEEPNISHNDDNKGTITNEGDFSTFTQCFGDNVYALSSKYGSGEGKPSTRSVFLCYQDDDYIGPFRMNNNDEEEVIKTKTTKPLENTDWKFNQRKPSASRDEAIKRITASGLPTVDVMPVINNSDRIFELGVYYHNPFNWNGWSREVSNSGGRFCVLSGDAAHAMPPFLGQGGNQAIQDAFCLSSQIYEYNGDLVKNDSLDDQTSLKKYLKEYEKIRWAPTALISFKSFLLGYVEIGPGILSKVRDVIFFVLGRAGIAQKVFLSAATPKVEAKEEEV